MAVTIRDVAKRAGVSASTVSIVYNAGPGAARISAPTRAKVEQAIQELNYEPNAIARSTSLKKFDALGVAISCGPLSLGMGTPYMQAVGGIGQACAERNYLCAMHCLGFGTGETPKFLRPRCVDMVLALHQLEQDTLERSASAGIHVMLVNATPAGDLASVNFDESASARIMLDRLGGLGHRRIAYIANFHNRGHYSQTDRHGAYAQWCRERGAPAHATESGDELSWSEGSVESLVQWIKGLMALPEPVTAVVVYSDFVARTLLHSLPKAGISVPGQISLATWPAEEAMPPEGVGGMMFRPYQLGAVAAAEAIASLRDKRRPQSHLLPAEWRQGTSIGPAPA